MTEVSEMEVLDRDLLGRADFEKVAEESARQTSKETGIKTEVRVVDSPSPHRYTLEVTTDTEPEKDPHAQ